MARRTEGTREQERLDEARNGRVPCPMAAREILDQPIAPTTRVKI